MPRAQIAADPAAANPVATKPVATKPVAAKPVAAKQPRAKSDRRSEILAAAQRCFVRAGFHGASMQDICNEAGMSPGNLYRYFPSKEALIAGIAERDRAEVAQEFASADLSKGFFAVLEGMAYHHFSERPDEQVKLCTEIMAEARRHPEIARISAAFDADVKKWIIDLMHAGADRGDIARDLDFDAVATMLIVIADGVWWRRALDPNFDAKALLPIFMDITRHMLGSRSQNRVRAKEGPG